MIYADKQVTCHDCGTVFTFSIKEQEQFASWGVLMPQNGVKDAGQKENRQYLK